MLTEGNKCGLFCSLKHSLLVRPITRKTSTASRRSITSGTGLAASIVAEDIVESLSANRRDSLPSRNVLETILFARFRRFHSFLFCAFRSQRCQSKFSAAYARVSVQPGRSKAQGSLLSPYFPLSSSSTSHGVGALHEKSATESRMSSNAPV